MIVKIAWAILAAIHALPALAFFRPAMIGRLYRITSDNPLFALMQHRAALFLVIFMLCVWAAFDPGSRRVASVGVGISMLSFLFLYWSAGAPPGLKTIAMTDLVGIPFLAFVLWKAFTA
jgi:hypothetical protein